jgi:UDP-N-acetyl-2-amino-2-deoxyglucuronate dehydrogenase
MVRFAIMGCGRIAQRHAEILSRGQVARASLVAVCDTQADRAQKFGQKYDLPYFPSLESMIQAKGNEIDAILILTPSGLHAQHCLEVAKLSKHVVVEKPMALTLEDADSMVRACDQAGVRLFVVKQNRYNVAVQKLRQALDERRFGKLVMGTIRVRWCRTQEYYNQDGWRGTWNLDGGVLANQASHHIDALTWMMGDVESVFAKSATALVDIECEDTAIAVLKFRNGALGIIEATTATRPKDLEGSISILGEKGSVEVAGFALNEVRTWNFVEKKDGDDQVVASFRDTPPSVYGFGHQKYLDHVVECIEHGHPALVDGLEGKKSLEIITALYESIETGREVHLRFSPDKCRLGRPAALASGTMASTV